MRKTPMYRGKAPHNDGWRRICDFSRDGIKWVLHFKHQAHDHDWLTFKLRADGRAPKKANYWFSWHTSGRYAHQKDLIHLRTHRPDLAQTIAAVVSAFDLA